jgi:Na+/proline symporter
VLTFGVIAYVLALRAEGVFHLVEQASAFGSAGTLVAVVFGLFTRLGGPWTAMATILVGMVAYLGGVTLDSPYPFLLSLAASLCTYVLGAVLGLGHRPVGTPVKAE